MYFLNINEYRKAGSTENKMKFNVIDLFILCFELRKSQILIGILYRALLQTYVFLNILKPYVIDPVPTETLGKLVNLSVYIV